MKYSRIQMPITTKDTKSIKRLSLPGCFVVFVLFVVKNIALPTLMTESVLLTAPRGAGDGRWADASGSGSTQGHGRGGHGSGCHALSG